MKALVYEGPQHLSYKDVPDPIPQEGEHLIRIEAVGICGSDMHAYLGHDDRRPAPLILGHEAAGVIVEGPQKGRRVTINPLVTCGVCNYCTAGRENLCSQRQIISMPPRQGAFAEYVTMPERNLITVPDHIPLAKAALAEPLAVSWHAVKLGLAILDTAMAQEALVIGGGAIGVAAALALQAQGEGTVTVVEPNPKRRAFLTDSCGLDAVEQVTAPFSLVIDAVGLSQTRALASQVVRPGGVIVHIGLGEDTGGLDVRRMTLQEITFIGTYTYTAEDFADTTNALFLSDLGSLDWNDQVRLSEGGKVFAQIRQGQIIEPKIMLMP